jgi:ABC-type branched-subunit amino acid transport system ATPase component
MTTKPYAIECVNIKKAFGSVDALKGVSMFAKPGEVTAIIGDNGAGKSTLIKCISGVYNSDEGEIKINGEVVAKYRDQRLTQVSNNTVRLELAFLSVVFEQARKEWGLAVSNPLRQIRMPKPGKSRTRRLEAGEEEALLTACAASGAHYLHSFVVLAIETGMRFGELAGVQWKYVDLDKRTIFLPDTKNGQARTVPLSTRAVAAVQILIHL